MEIRVVFEGRPMPTFTKFLEQLKSVSEVRELSPHYMRGVYYTNFLIISKRHDSATFLIKIMKFARTLQGEARLISVKNITNYK